MSRARNIADIITSAGSGGGSGLATYDNIVNLPASGNTGDLAYVTDNQKMYLWNGSVWFHILTAETPNTAPFITTQPKFGYSLATDGTPLVLTLNATDPEGTAITWNYTVTSGTLGNTATISVNNNQFTITPSTNTADAGEFTLTFTASDGLHVANSNPTYFSLYFSYDWIYGTMTVENSISNPAFGTIVSGATSTTLRFGNCIKFMRPNELLVSSPGAAVTTAVGAIWIYDTSNVPATCIAHYTKVGNGTTSGGSLGLSVDFNDDWIIAATDENGTSGNAQVLWFKRNSDGTWPVDANGRLTVYQETTGATSSSVFGVDNLKTVSMDKNNNRCIIGNGIRDGMWIYEYNTSTTQWEQVFTSTVQNPVYSSMLDDYALIVSYNTDPLILYKRSPEGIWSQINQYYLYSLRGYAKLLAYNGNHYIVLVGGSQGATVTNTNSYDVEILKIDELSNNISQIKRSGETKTGTAGTESDVSGNFINMDYADAYISGNTVHVIVARSCTTVPDVRYFQVANLDNGNVVQKNISPEGLTITGAGGANPIHTVAFDRYTGKLAVAQTTYNTGVADAGKVWILR